MIIGTVSPEPLVVIWPNLRQTPMKSTSHYPSRKAPVHALDMIAEFDADVVRARTLKA